MKKAKAGSRESASKKRVAQQTVDEYLARVPEPARTTMSKVRAVIRSVVPAETTEAISYGVPTFRYNGPVIWYAAFSSHCSVFPTAAVIEQFKDELKAYTTSKGTIQFPVDKPLPATLLRKIVKARLAEIGKKKRR
jgi:uncharacterized protein YdhG (YjbR/CyaY superfamily)